MRHGRHGIVAFGRRASHFQRVRSPLAASLAGSWASLVHRGDFHPVRSATGSGRRGGAVAVHARGRGGYPTDLEHDLVHCLTPSTTPREYRGPRETLASSDSSEVEVRGMRSPDCPSWRHRADRLGHFPPVGIVPQHGEAVKPKSGSGTARATAGRGQKIKAPPNNAPLDRASEKRDTAPVLGIHILDEYGLARLVA
jgi:hypothetical protein